jgi:antitoxin (DNA-binding transcriptional repressor) of toxin-antitoxin stability system
MSESIPISIAKSQFSEIIDRVEAGDKLLSRAAGSPSPSFWQSSQAH